MFEGVTPIALKTTMTDEIICASEENKNIINTT